MSWELASLDEVCTPASSNLAQKDLFDMDGEYPIYGASGLIKNVDFYKQDKPYVAIVKDGAGVGRTMLLPACSSVIGTMQYILPKPNVDVGYLYYSIDSLNLARYHTGATIPHIYFKDYKKETIPLPPFDVQRRISETLDKVQALIAARREQIAVLDKLAKDLFVDMFGDPINNEKEWDVKQLGDVSTVRIGPFGSLLHREDYIVGGVPLINPQHMVNGTLAIDDEFTISETKHRGMMSYDLQEGDIVLGRRGEIGRCAIVKNEHLPAICGTGSMIVRLDKQQANPTFIHALFYQSRFMRELEEKATGSTMKNINVGIVKNLYIPLPSLDVQLLFTNHITTIAQQKARLIESLSILENTYKSILQKAFSGELFQ